MEKERRLFISVDLKFLNLEDHEINENWFPTNRCTCAFHSVKYLCTCILLCENDIGLNDT